MGSRARLSFIAAGATLLLAAVALLAERLEDTIFIPLDDPAILYAGPTKDVLLGEEIREFVHHAATTQLPEQWEKFFKHAVDTTKKEKF